MLYDTLRARANVQLLAMEFLRKPVADACPWIYQVKVMTASGSVVELDFNADGLDLVGARGPENDHDADALVERLGGTADFLKAGANNSSKSGGPSTASNSGKGGGSGNGGSGEGGHSGSGSGSDGSGGSGGDSGGEGGDGGGEGGDGGGDGDHSGPGGGDD
jgi:hypothetical protein